MSNFTITRHTFLVVTVNKMVKIGVHLRKLSQNFTFLTTLYTYTLFTLSRKMQLISVMWLLYAVLANIAADGRRSKQIHGSTGGCEMCSKTQ